MTTILVIEDMDSLREEIVDTLTYEGFHAIGAANGVLGLEYIQQRLPDLIVCDIMMPEMDGHEMLRRVRADERTATIPFIFLTAKADKSDLREGMDLGADDYLTKPFTVAELIRAVQTRLKKHEATRQYFDRQISEAEERLELLAHRDALTDLPNRVLFRERLDRAIQYAERTHQSITIICLDIDRFNTINNTLGHAIGDRMMQAIAERLNRFVPPCDTVARLRGDEFAIAIAGLNTTEEIEGFVEQLLDTLSRPYALYGHNIFITASVGVASYPRHATYADGLMEKADMAMYAAKQQGRNGYRLYSAELDTMASESMALENSLRRGLDREEFRLYYQPQVDLRSGQIVAVEALLRWQHPSLGLVGPDRFIPLAEETGTIQRLGQWVLGEACQQFRQWQDAGLTLQRVAINLSTQQFRQGSKLREIIDAAIAAAGIGYNNIELEVTESTILRSESDVRDTLMRLQGLGTRVAIDDFGTGYCSLSYLKQFPVNVLKIDRSFVMDLPADKHDAAISASIVDLARSLSLQVVAEGVETQEQLEFLRQHGCDFIQGYLFSPPLPPAELEELMRNPAAL